MALATIQRSTPQKQYQNADGPGGQPINYGPSRGGGVAGQDPFAGGAAPYGMSPWVGGNAGVPLPWSGPPGQSVGTRTPQYTPDAGDPRNAGYFYRNPAQAAGGQWDQQQAANVSRGQQQIQNDPQAAAALASGDWKTMTARLHQMGQQAQADRFIQGGGTQQGWDSRFGQAWPTPTMANGQRAPGAPVSAGGPQQQMNPNVGSQSGSSMITGYQPSGLTGSPASGSGYGGASVDPYMTGPMRSTGGAQSTLAADAQRTMPGNFTPPPGPTGRPTTGPVSMPPSNPSDPRQLPNPYVQGNSGYSPFMGSQYGGSVGYDMGGMGQMFSGGGYPQQQQFNPYGGGGAGSNMAQSNPYAGQSWTPMQNMMNGGGDPQLQNQLMQANQMRSQQGYGGGMGLGNYNQGWGGQGGGAQQFNPQMMQMLMSQQGGGYY